MDPSLVPKSEGPGAPSAGHPPALFRAETGATRLSMRSGAMAFEITICDFKFALIAFFSPTLWRFSLKRSSRLFASQVKVPRAYG
jgi:hypothetical protein